MSSEQQIDIELDLAPGMTAEDDTIDRRRVNTPERQGSSIPVGWKPTVAKPIPVVRCHHVWPDDHYSGRGGERCNKWSLRGSQLCFYHSGRGNLKNVEAYRQAIIESARLQLTEAVPDAMGTLLELMSAGTADNVRLKAATEVLDRTGIRSAEQLQVEITTTDAPALTLAQRLEKLRAAAVEMQRREEERLTAAQAEAETALAITAGDPEVIEGEIES